MGMAQHCWNKAVKHCGYRAGTISVYNPRPQRSCLYTRPSSGCQLTCSASMSISEAPGSASQQARTRPSQGDLVRASMFSSPAPLIDIGFNFVDKSYAQDRPAILQRALEANVQCCIVTGTSTTTSAAAMRLCHDPPNYPLYFTAGVHPHNAKTSTASTLEELRRLSANEKCVAIGECGLDFNRNFSPPAVQEDWFEAQVQLAKELRKPLFMHCRDAGDKFAEILRRHQPLGIPAVIHCFTGSAQELRDFLDLGLHIGITGWICDDRPERGGAELASLLPSIPLDRLMIETDAPYLTPRTIKPSKVRPSRNEPALLPHVLEAAATAMGLPAEELARSTTAVAKQVFGIVL